MHVLSCSIVQIITEMKFNVVYLLGKNNPGFDSITFFKDSYEETIAVAIENRFSEPTSSTTLNIKDLKQKYKLTINSIKKNFGIPRRRIYLVFCYWRDVPNYLADDIKSSDKLPNNTLLLRKNDLEFLYGPLSRRPYLGFKPNEENDMGLEESDEMDSCDEGNVSD